jgi:serum/glucocorticoid-regulated kinase 2
MKLIDKEFIIKNKKQGSIYIIILGIVQNERDIMRFLNHPFIIELEWSFESRNFVVFVVPFCCGGELFLQLK